MQLLSGIATVTINSTRRPTTQQLLLLNQHDISLTSRHVMSPPYCVPEPTAVRDDRNSIVVLPGIKQYKSGDFDETLNSSYMRTDGCVSGT